MKRDVGRQVIEMKYAITESEHMILEQLWTNGEMSVMQLVEALEEVTGWSKHTIISFLKRMEEKHTVSFCVQGRTKLYRALPERTEVVTETTKGILDRFFGGRMGKMVSYMADADQLTDADIDELYDLLGKLKEGKSSDRS